jgi:hypothetical protein
MVQWLLDCPLARAMTAEKTASYAVLPTPALSGGVIVPAAHYEMRQL